MKINNYQYYKQQARERAQQWQHDFSDYNYFMSELMSNEEFFYRLGKRYGLIKEFKENGII